jgi:hypothetical protein
VSYDTVWRRQSQCDRGELPARSRILVPKGDLPTAEAFAKEFSGSLSQQQRWASPALRQARSVLLSLRHPHDVQKSPCFGGAKFVRNHQRSGLNHVLGRPYCCIGAFAQVDDFEHGEGMFGDLLIVRISSHGSDILRPVGVVAKVP